MVESYIKRLKEMEDIALSYPGVVKTYTIQAGRELRVIVGAEKLSDMESESLSHDIAKKIQDEMTYPGQVKITVIRETRSVAYANRIFIQIPPSGFYNQSPFPLSWKGLFLRNT